MPKVKRSSVNYCQLMSVGVVVYVRIACKVSTELDTD